MVGSLGTARPGSLRMAVPSLLWKDRHEPSRSGGRRRFEVIRASFLCYALYLSSAHWEGSISGSRPLIMSLTNFAEPQASVQPTEP